MVQGCIFHSKERTVLILFLCTMFVIERAWSRKLPGSAYSPRREEGVYNRYGDDDVSMYQPYPAHVQERRGGSKHRTGTGFSSNYRSSNRRPSPGFGSDYRNTAGLEEGEYPAYNGMRSYGGGVPRAFGGHRGVLPPYEMDNTFAGIDEYYGGGGRNRRAVDMYPVNSMPRDYNPVYPEMEEQYPWNAGSSMDYYGYGNPYSMMDFQGDEGMGAMPEDDFLMSRGRRSFGFPRDEFSNAEANYYDNIVQPYDSSYSYEAPTTPTPVTSEPDSRSFPKHHHTSYHSRNRQQPQKGKSTDNVYSRGSYGPYGYEDDDFDESLIQELNMDENEEPQPNNEFYMVDGNAGPNEAMNSEITLPLMRGGGDRRNNRMGKKSQDAEGQDANALEEEIVLGNLRNMRRGPQDSSPDKRPGGIKSNVSPNAAIRESRRPAARKSSGNSNLIPSRTHQSVVPSAPVSKGKSIYPPSPRGGDNAPMKASEEEESPAMGSFPGEASPRRGYRPGGQEEIDESGVVGLDGMYGMNELNRRRRSALADTFYNDRTYPIIRPVAMRSPSRYYPYEGQSMYTYEYPSLVYDRMRRQGEPMQLLINRRRDVPRRMVRRVVKRLPLPLMRKEKQLRRMIQPIPEVEVEDEGSYEEEEDEVQTTNAVEVEAITTDAPSSDVSTTDSTDVTTAATSSPPEVTEVTPPEENDTTTTSEPETTVKPSKTPKEKRKDKRDSKN